jgi:hypothetical protein
MLAIKTSTDDWANQIIRAQADRLSLERTTAYSKLDGLSPEVVRQFEVAANHIASGRFENTLTAISNSLHVKPEKATMILEQLSKEGLVVIPEPGKKVYDLTERGHEIIKGINAPKGFWPGK